MGRSIATPHKFAGGGKVPRAPAAGTSHGPDVLPKHSPVPYTMLTHQRKPRTASPIGFSHRPCAQHIRRVTCGLAVAMLALSAVARAQEVRGDDPSPHSAVELLAERPAIVADGTVTVALRVTLDAGWHTYWVNGGDAGLPISVAWTLPPGITAGPLRFPTPSLLPQPPLMSYGYEHEVFYLADLRADPALPTGSVLAIRANAEWLACADVCLPAAGTVTLELPVVSAAEASAQPRASVVQTARSRLPIADPGVRASAWRHGDGYLVMVSGARAPVAGREHPYFFADSVGVVDHAAPQYVSRRGDTLVLELSRSPFAPPTVERLGGVLAWTGAGEGHPAFLLELSLLAERESLVGREAALAIRSSMPRDSSGGARGPGDVGNASSSDAASAADAGAGPDFGADSSASLGLLAAALFAFLGGILLNLMPCVFPILSVKVLSFVQHGGGERRQTVRHALLFALGVLITLWTISGVLLALRAGGASLGWGFQLQSPMVVALLALLLFALALNLSGTFELGVSLTRLGGVGAGNRLSDSFLTGALAVVVATPCTAPFMGAAIGYALVQPPAVALTVFTALALGLALPYVLLASVPALLRRLPRPGAWLETFKQALAFPMYATVVWLLWVFGQQAGIDALALLLLSLTLTAFAAWAWGRALHSASRSLHALAAVALLVAAGVAWRGSRSPAVVGVAARETSSSAASSVAWEAFSPEALAGYQAAGRPVFVDVTAAWCLSCQVNERVALQASRVRAKFTEANVVLLRADWTSRDSVIARVLASHGRSGVPLYVIYPAAPGAAPEILPSILTPGIVLAAIERARS